jgi:hypothetical protein
MFPVAGIVTVPKVGHCAVNVPDTVLHVPVNLVSS